jgi:ABC-2 type transport system permease protein
MRKFFKELNAVVTIAARDLTHFFNSPAQLAIALVMPIIFLGLMGGSLSQNLGGNLPYNFLQFVLLGMVVITLYQGAMTGVVSLMEDRKSSFTQEIFVAPISRYSIIIGKAVGATITSLISLVGTFAVALFMHIPLTWADFGHIMMVAPFVALSGAALGIFFISLVTDPDTADRGSFLLIFPQTFLAGAIIPVIASTGILKFLADILPMTYLVDLIRGVFYQGKPEFHHVVLHSIGFNIAVTAAFFVVFIVVGTILFTRKERDL